MPIYFNNCRSRDHVAIFGPGAFFDLYQTGQQASMAVNLLRGAECVVATPIANGDVEFRWWSFSHESLKVDEEGVEVRVFFGDAVRRDVLSKANAWKTEPYMVFFNVKGHFKRPSVISSKT